MKPFIFIMLNILIYNISYADTFNAEPGQMSATFDSRTGSVTLTWSGIGNIAFIEQYLTQEFEGKWILRHKANNNSALFNGFIGERFNVIDDKGRYLLLTPEMIVARLRPVKFIGLSIECRNKDDCALQVLPDNK